MAAQQQQRVPTRAEQLDPASRDGSAIGDGGGRDRVATPAISGHANGKRITSTTAALRDTDKEWILFPNVQQRHDSSIDLRGGQVSPAARNGGAIASSWYMLQDPTQGSSTPHAPSVVPREPVYIGKARRQQHKDKKIVQDSLCADVLDSDDEDADSSTTQWGSLPRQEGDGSFLFFEDQVQDGTAPADQGGSTLLPSIYASTFATRRLPTAANLTSAVASTAPESDMLSLPSSLSAVSSTEDTTSRNGSSGSFASPLFRDNESLRTQRQREPSAALTEAALSRLDEASNSRTLYKDQEAGLTSGSDNDRDGEYSDADEDLLSRTPGAQSAGIRAMRASHRQRSADKVASSALQPLALSHISGNLAMVPQRAESKVSGKSVQKRRHRHAGISDKGSKRSHTGSVRQTASCMDAAAISSNQYYSSASRSPKMGNLQRLRETAAAVFQIEEEVMEAVTGTSVTSYDQGCTPRRHRRHSRQSSYSSNYARSKSFNALSAHAASELGETSGIHQMFSRPVYSVPSRHSHHHHSEDEGCDVYYDSGAETETEQQQHHHAYRTFSSSNYKAFSRLSRKSAVSAWEAASSTMDNKTRRELEVFLKTHEPKLWAEVSKLPRHARQHDDEEEDEHTQSLGLDAYHREGDFSITASLQQILFRALPAVLSSLR